MMLSDWCRRIEPVGDAGAAASTDSIDELSLCDCLTAVRFCEPESFLFDLGVGDTLRAGLGGGVGRGGFVSLLVGVAG